MTIVNGKVVISGAWTIFQHGKNQWYYCDEKSTARGPYITCKLARAARRAAARAKGLEPGYWPEQRQCAQLGLAGYLVHDAEEIALPPAASRSTSRARRGRARAATSPTRRAAKRAKASTKPSGSVRGKA